MADVAAAPDRAPGRTALHRPLWRRLLLWLAGLFAAVLVLLLIVYVGLDTSPGKRFVADRLAAYTTETGLNIKVGRIEGSIYGAMVLDDVRVSDPHGVFATSPRLAVDWRPFSFLRNHVDVRSLQSPLITVQRSPTFAVVPNTTPNAPILPDLKIDVDRFSVDRLVLEPAVSGQRHLVQIGGTAHIADRRAQLVTDARALVGAGVAGGDTLHLLLDAVPDDNRLAIDATLDAPAGGVVSSLAKLTAPLAVRISGRGDWRQWRGKGLANYGGASLADLDLAADGGTFRVTGPTHPGLYLKGPVERLTAPALIVDSQVTLDQRIARTKLQARSSAGDVIATGVVDLARSQFHDFAVEARLLTPGAILPNLSGKNVQGRFVLDGPMATPTLDYRLTAAALGFNTMVVEQLQATGLARVDSRHILIPVQASARRIAGLNAAAGGLVDNIRIGGSFGYENGKLLSDNLKIRSSKIDATAIVVADLPKGRYTGGLNGRVNDYTLQGVGIVNLTTNAKLVTEPAGGFAITGRVVAKTARIFNAGAQSFLGGNATVRADVGYDTKGVISFSGLRLAAPLFTVVRGQGRYEPTGAITASADAVSKQYGPLSAQVTGTIAKPVAVLHAAHPGVGVGLANLNARVVGDGNAYAVTANGGTDYGPFTADLLVTAAKQLAIDIRRAQFAGVGFQGRVVQNAAGPFDGRVNFAGSGISGAALLSSAGKAQRADVAARALDAHVPGVDGFTIGRGIANASVILLPQGPSVNADVQVANLHYGETLVETARTKILYANGSGTAQAVANGNTGVPFRIAANARFSPQQYLVALQGQANGIGFRTANPARIVPANGTYRLDPTRIDFDKGSLRIAGSYGADTTAQLVLDRLDLSVVNAFLPDLGLGGAVTGTVNYAQPRGAPVPQIDAHATVSNFTRTSYTAQSEPVDIVLASRLGTAGGDLRAILRRGPSVVGQLFATVTPPPGTAPWLNRLTSATLGGGIRYSGPAAVLFSFAGLANQTLTGPIALAADFGGKLLTPTLNGLLRADNLTYQNDAYGTRLTQMRLAGRFTADRLEISQLQAKAGDGTIAGSGTVGLAAASGFPITINAQFQNAQLARGDALGATATGNIKFVNDPHAGASATGQLTLPEVRYQVVTQRQADVLELTGVRRKSDVIAPGGAAGQAAAQQAAAFPTAGGIKLDLRIKADNQVYVSGMGLDSEWSANLRVTGTSGAPIISGRAEIVRGTYTFSGKRFDVSRGVVLFNGGPATDPTLDLAATTTVNGVTAEIDITGTGQHPQVAFTSTPALPQDEVLARLLFGSSVTNLSPTEAVQLAVALNSLRGSSGGGLNPLGKLRSATGIDRLRVLGADQTTGRGTAVAAGKYITKNIYIEIITDTRGFTATQLEVALSKTLRLLSQAGAFGGSNVNLRYQRNF